MKHYRLKPYKLSNDPATQWADYLEDGYYFVEELLIVPISKINYDNWNPGRYKFYQEAFAEGKPADPVRLARSGSRFEVDDGNHRIAASEDYGYTHVPARVTKKVQGQPDVDPPANLYDEIHGRELLYSLQRLRSGLNHIRDLYLDWGGTSRSGYWFRVTDERFGQDYERRCEVRVDGDRRQMQMDWKGTKFRHRGNKEAVERAFIKFMRQQMESKEARVARIAGRVVSGMIEPPPRMVDQIYRWTKAKMAAGQVASRQAQVESTKIDIARHEKLLKEAHQKNDEEEIEYEMDRLQLLKKYLAIDEAKLKEKIEEARAFPRVRIKRWNRAARKFKVDTRGWKYAPLLKKADPKRVQYAESLWGVIKVELVKGNIDTKAKAYWKASSATLRIQTGGDLKYVIKHELVHWAQSYMNVALWIKDFGRPPKDVRTPEFKQRMEVPADLAAKLKRMGIAEPDIHDLDDVEFYSELADTVGLFHHAMKQPGVKGMSPREVFDQMVGAHGEASNTFFRRLQKGSKAKWKKAVGEFAKAVL